jgi:hypothetical protein
MDTEPPAAAPGMGQQLAVHLQLANPCGAESSSSLRYGVEGTAFGHLYESSQRPGEPAESEGQSPARSAVHERGDGLTRASHLDRHRIGVASAHVKFGDLFGQPPVGTPALRARFRGDEDHGDVVRPASGTALEELEPEQLIVRAHV